MATLGELESDNPNLGQQLELWRAERIANDEDGFDYEAFRQHVMAIGAPDPGEQEFDGFRPERQQPQSNRWRAE